MKNILLSFSILAVILFSACKKTYSPPADSGYVMFVNGCVGGGNLFTATKSNSIPGAGGSLPGTVAFQGCSKYQSVLQGMDSMFFIFSGLDTLAAGTASVTDGYYYSQFVGGTPANPLLLFISDDLSVPDIRMAKIRFVNLSSDKLSETVSAGTTIFATGIPHQSASSFFQIASGAYTITASDPSETNSAVSTGTVQLNTGKIYTVMLN